MVVSERGEHNWKEDKVIWEKTVLQCVCLSWQRRESQTGESEARASTMTKTAFSKWPTLEYVFPKTEQGPFPNQQTIWVFVCECGYMCKKMKQEKPRKEGKKCWLWTFQPQLQTHPLAWLKWAPVLEVPPVFSPLGLRLELNLARLSDEDFAIVPEKEGKQEVEEVDH